jgi:hypothetical protein
MNHIIKGATEVRFAYIGLVKKCSSQIAIIENRVREIGFREVDFVQRTARELGLFPLDLVEG